MLTLWRTFCTVHKPIVFTIITTLVIILYVKGDHRILKINRLTLDYVFLNKYTLKMKYTHFFIFINLRSHDSLVKFNM